MLFRYVDNMQTLENLYFRQHCPTQRSSLLLKSSPAIQQSYLFGFVCIAGLTLLLPQIQSQSVHVLVHPASLPTHQNPKLKLERTFNLLQPKLGGTDSHLGSFPSGCKWKCQHGHIVCWSSSQTCSSHITGCRSLYILSVNMSTQGASLVKSKMYLEQV